MRISYQGALVGVGKFSPMFHTNRENKEELPQRACTSVVLSTEKTRVQSEQEKAHTKTADADLRHKHQDSSA